MSTTMLDIYEVHSLGCTSINSEDSSLRTTTHSPSSLDMYEVYSLPYAKYENPSNDERLPRLQCLKSQPPGGQHYTAMVSKSPTKVDMYESPCKWHKTIPASPDLIYKMASTYKEHKIKSPSELHKPRIILSNSSPETDTLVKVDHAGKWHEFESTLMMSSLPESIPASEWYASKTAPAYKESRFEAPSKRYKVKTHSEWRKIKSSSSMCLMCPRLQTPVPDVHEVSTPGRA